MTSATFALEQYTEDNTHILATMTEMDNESIESRLNISATDEHLPGDAQGIFFDLADEGLLGALQISGDEIGTVAQGPANGVQSVPLKESSPNSAAAEISPEALDLGIGIELQGGAAPVSPTIFTIKSTIKDFALADSAGEEIDIRMQSATGDSEDSSKPSGEVVIDPPSLSYAMSPKKLFFQISYGGASAPLEWSDAKLPDQHDWTGEEIIDQFTITNDDEVGANLTNAKINDLLIISDRISQIFVGSTHAGNSDDNGVFEPEKTWSLEGTYQVAKSDIDEGSLLNTAFTLATENGKSVLNEKDEATANTYQLPLLLIAKTGDRDVVGEMGEITHEIGVQNHGNVILPGLGANDPLVKSSASDPAGKTDSGSLPDVHERWTYKGIYQVSLEDFDNKGDLDCSIDGWIHNTASAMTSFGSGSVTEVGAFYWTTLAPDIVNSGQEEQGLFSV
jgi:hypothetical protein